MTITTIRTTMTERTPWELLCREPYRLGVRATTYRITDPLDSWRRVRVRGIAAAHWNSSSGVWNMNRVRLDPQTRSYVLPPVVVR